MAVSARLVTVANLAMTGAAQPLFSAPYPKICKLILKAPSANAANVRLGDSAVTAARGIELVKGAAQEITASAGNAGGSLLLAIDELRVFGTAADVLEISYWEVL